MNASVAEVVQSELAAQTSIAEFKPFEANLAEYKARYENVVYDMTDKKQEKQARSDRLAIGKVVAELDRVHAATKAPLLEQVRILDGERKRIKDDLQTVQGGIKKQIEEHEAKIQAIEDALIARVEAIRAMAMFEGEPTSDQVMARILQLKKVVINHTFAHYEPKAVIAKQEANAALSALYDKVAQAESDAAELDRLRQEAAERERKDREDKIAAEAAAKAKVEAEKAAERDRLAREESERLARETAERAKRQAEEAARLATERAEQAERDRMAAEERAERERAEAAERAAAAEKQAAIDAAEAARKATEKAEQDQRDREERERRELEAREANEKHREEVDGLACAVLIDLCNLSPSAAKAIITAIGSGLVPNVKVNY